MIMNNIKSNFSLFKIKKASSTFWSTPQLTQDVLVLNINRWQWQLHPIPQVHTESPEKTWKNVALGLPDLHFHTRVRGSLLSSDFPHPRSHPMDRVSRCTCLGTTLKHALRATHWDGRLWESWGLCWPVLSGWCSKEARGICKRTYL